MFLLVRQTPLHELLSKEEKGSWRHQHCFTMPLVNGTDFCFCRDGWLLWEFHLCSLQHCVLLQDACLGEVMPERLQESRKQHIKTNPSFAIEGEEIWNIAKTFLPYMHWKRITPIDHTSTWGREGRGVIRGKGEVERFSCTTFEDILGGSLPMTKHSGGRYLKGN